jgi:hypothetical protein
MDTDWDLDLADDNDIESGSVVNLAGSVTMTGPGDDGGLDSGSGSDSGLVEAGAAATSA